MLDRKYTDAQKVIEDLAPAVAERPPVSSAYQVVRHAPNRDELLRLLESTRPTNPEMRNKGMLSLVNNAF